MRNRKCALLAAAMMGAVPAVCGAVPLITFTYDPAAVQYSTSSTFPTGAFTTTVDITNNTVTLPVGDYFRFGVDAAVSNDPNPAAGGAYDQQNGITEPAGLGISGFGFAFNTSNNSVLAPVKRAGSSAATTRFTPDPYSVTGSGNISSSNGQIGYNGGFLGAGLAPFSFDGAPASYDLIDSFASNALLFSNVVYRGLTNGTATITAFIPTGADGVVTLDPSYTSPATNTQQPTYASSTAITTANLPALTVIVSTLNVSSVFNSSSGSWNDPSRWISTPTTGAFPNNTSGAIYNVAINGGPAAVTEASLASPVVVNSLDLSGATLNLSSSLSITNPVSISAGSLNQTGGTLTSPALQLSGGGIYQISGGGLAVGSIQVGNSSAPGAGDKLVVGSAASLTLSGPISNYGTVVLAGTQNYSAGVVFNNFGSATLSSDAGANLSINNSAGTLLFTTTQHLASLRISNGSSAQITGGGAGNRSLLITPSLSVAGTLDLSDNALVVEGGGATALAALTALIQQGFNGTTWTGTGINSSVAAADSNRLTALGIIQNNQGGSAIFGSGNLFDGYAPAASDVLAAYTYYGDTNLDGRIDGSDYARIDNGVITNATGWFNGDFNYDGVINGSDYALIDNSANSQNGTLAAQLGSPNVSVTAQIGAASVAAVPEPGAMVVGAATAMALLSRRSRVRSLS